MFAFVFWCFLGSGFAPFEWFGAILIAIALFLGLAQVLYMVSNRSWKAGGWGAPVMGAAMALAPILWTYGQAERNAILQAEELLQHIREYQVLHERPPARLSDLTPHPLARIQPVGLGLPIGPGLLGRQAPIFIHEPDTPVSIRFRVPMASHWECSVDGIWRFME